MQSRTATGIVIPILLAAMLAAVDASAQQQPDQGGDASQQAAPQQAGPPDTSSCVGSGAIVDGQRQPPTPDEVKEIGRAHV